MSNRLSVVIGLVYRMQIYVANNWNYRMFEDGVSSLKIPVKNPYWITHTLYTLVFIVQMEAIYVPEDDRCTDILGLVEDEDDLKYFHLIRCFSSSFHEGI